MKNIEEVICFLEERISDLQAFIEKNPDSLRTLNELEIYESILQEINYGE